MQIITCLLSGAHLVHDVGMLGCVMSASLEQLVMGDEIISYAKRIARGANIDDESLALDVIHEVGPGGEFLSHIHTLQHFKEELWQPSLIEVKNYDAWAAGKKDMFTRTHEKTKEILENHKVPKLPEKTINELDTILKKAEARIMYNKLRKLKEA